MGSSPPLLRSLLRDDLSRHASAEVLRLGWRVRLVVALLTWAINLGGSLAPASALDPTAARWLFWLTTPYLLAAIGLSVLQLRATRWSWPLSLGLLCVEAGQCGLSLHYTGFANPISLGYLVLFVSLPGAFIDGRHGLLAFTGGSAALIGVTALDSLGLAPAGQFLREPLHYPPGLVPMIALQCALLLAIVYVSVAIAGARARWLRDELTRQNIYIEHQILRRYLPAPLVASLLSDTEAWSSPRRVHVTVFFSDLVGFTAQAETLEPEALARALDRYFSEMVRVAHKHQGTVDKFIGDAVMVVFGAPIVMPAQEQAQRAVAMAEEMQQVTAQLRARWAAEGPGLRPLARMGVHCGEAVVGVFGGPERREFTAVGDVVNLASRLEGQAEPGGVLISGQVWAQLEAPGRWTSRGEITVKNRSQAVASYALQVDASASEEAQKPTDGQTRTAHHPPAKAG